MKKLLLIAAMGAFVFNSCKDDKTSPSTNNLTTSNVDYEFTIKFAGKIHKVKGSKPGNYPRNGCTASSGLVTLGIGDATLPDYISGDIIYEIIYIPNLTSVGTTKAFLNFSWALTNPSAKDYFDKLGTSIETGASLSPGYFDLIRSTVGGLIEIPLTITDLGTQSTYAANRIDINWGRTFNGNYSGILYFTDFQTQDADDKFLYNIAVPYSIDFKALRLPI